MLNYLWPILLVISANTVYNIAAKSTPGSVNTFASLTLTYLVAAIMSIALFFMTSQNKNIAAEIGKANWTAVAFGLAIVALEFGYINVYRVGWKVSTAPLVANIGLTSVLLFVGALFFKEVISARQLAGVAICALGLVLIAR